MEDLAVTDPLTARMTALMARITAGERVSRRDRRDLHTYLLMRCAIEIEHVCESLRTQGQHTSEVNLTSVPPISDDGGTR